MWVRYCDATHTKTDQHCRADDGLAIWNNLPQEFTDKAILSFRMKLLSLRFCVAAAGRHFEHGV